jgi:hypothetical protein
LSYGRFKRALFSLAEQIFPEWSISVARFNFVFGLEKVDQNPYNSSIKPMEMMQQDELRFSSGGSALETEKRTLKGQNHPFHYPSEACIKWSAAPS